MNKSIKVSIIIIFIASVIALITIASGHTSLTNCEYYKLRRHSLIFIIGIALLSLITGLLIKMEKDTRYIFIGVMTFGSFLINHHLYDKKYDEILEKKQTTITKAIIYDIGYNQFSTFLKIKTNPEKFKANVGLKKKSHIGNLKIGDTILIKYVTDCKSIIGFFNLAPTKQELNLYTN